ncbi:MAG: hypothetical protein QM704_14585 [Anaeromyxobacteraceae bacterium]
MIRTPSKLAVVLAAAAAALTLAACGDKCPTESPNIDKVPSCTYPPGATASVTIRVCEKCNQSATTCQVDIQGNTIQLDPMSEACSDASSCSGASCNINPNITCSFQVPAATGTYTLLVYDPGTASTKQGTLTVQQDAVASCAFP